LSDTTRDWQLLHIILARSFNIKLAVIITLPPGGWRRRARIKECAGHEC